jgi:dipeptidase
MGCDILVALGPATVDGRTLFGLNSHHHARQPQTLRRTAGRPFAAGEVVRTATVELPQARQTCTVLASQFPDRWGYEHGVNEHQLAVGYANWNSVLATTQPTLLAGDLVRLVLERCHGARQGLDLLCDLLTRHGHSAAVPHGGDAVFLLADPTEAFVVEAAGPAWACQEIQMVRAVSDVSIIRQDWDRINRGLADEVIHRGWWQCDGSKLDFAGTLSVYPTGRASALRRWGRATLLLEQQNGRIDDDFFRRLLADHYEGARYEFDPLTGRGQATPLCRHAAPASPVGTVASFVAPLAAEAPAKLAWCAFGPPCVCVHVPVFYDGELPAALTSTESDGLWWKTRHLLDTLDADERRWSLVRDALGQLQARLELEAAEFLAEAPALKQQDGGAALGRQAHLLMQGHVERYEATLEALAAPVPVRQPAAGVPVS